jgi:hypothetical protein
MLGLPTSYAQAPHLGSDSEVPIGSAAKSCEPRNRGTNASDIITTPTSEEGSGIQCGNRAAAQRAALVFSSLSYGRHSPDLRVDRLFQLGGIIGPLPARLESRGSDLDIYDQGISAEAAALPVLQRPLFGIVFGTEQLFGHSKTRRLHRSQMGYVIRVQPPQA